MTDITAPTPAVGDGGPDMVQLLTPEGQRVANAAAAEALTIPCSSARACHP